MDEAYSLGNRFGRDPNVENDDRKKYADLTTTEKYSFWRGYFDLHGTVRKDYFENEYICKIWIADPFLTKELNDLFDVPFVYNGEYSYQIQGINCLELLYKLYDNVSPLSNVNAHILWNMMYGWRRSNSVCVPNCKFMKTIETAYPPAKAHISDSGYDLHLMKHVKTENDVEFYDTGIAVQPPVGCYFELVARSSLAKTGYVLANSIGIIDASYTGSIKVALIKVCKEAPTIELPARLVQLIPRQFIHLPMQEVSSFMQTSRDDGGFGSSGSASSSIDPQS